MIEVLKQMVDALKLSAISIDNFSVQKKSQEAIQAGRQAIAELESQEPVAWGVDWGKAGDIPCVSIIKRLPNGGIKVMAVEYAPYSYTHPPQRTWVVFPTMLRKMWSGGEVQAWLDENVNKKKNNA